MTIKYAVYEVKPGGYAREPLTAGIAPNLEAATERVAKNQFKNRNPEIKVIDEITAEIAVRNPKYTRYKVIVLSNNE